MDLPCKQAVSLAGLVRNSCQAQTLLEILLAEERAAPKFSHFEKTKRQLQIEALKVEIQNYRERILGEALKILFEAKDQK